MLNKGNPEPNSLSRELQVLVGDIEIFEVNAKMRNYSIRGYTEMSLRAFAALPAEEQKKKIDQLRHTLDVFIMHGAPISGNANGVTKSEEIQSVKKALDTYNLRACDDLDFVSQNQVIEIYDSQGIQIYRNLEFCKQCGYDLLTLCLYQWFELYERSSVVTESLFKSVGDAFKSGTATVRFPTQPHTMRQKHLNLKKVFYIVPGHVSPLFDKVTGQTRAVLTTLFSTEVTEPGAGDKILHLTT